MTPRSALFCISGSGLGGVAKAFDALADCLESCGWTVKVILPYKKHVDEATIDKRRIIGYAKKSLIRNKLLRVTVKLFHELTGWKFYWMGVPCPPHDVFVVYNPFEIEHWSRYSKKPSVVWLHNIVPVQRPTIRHPIAWLKMAFLTRSYRLFDHIIGVSAEACDTFVRRYALQRNPRILPNIIDVENILALSNASQSEIVRKDRAQIVCVGRLSSEKGCMRLLRVARRLLGEKCEFDLWFVGDGTLRNEMEAFIAKEDLRGCVHLLGRKDNPYPYIASSQLLLLPSSSEGFGLVLWEALLLCVPVVSTDVGGTRSALNGGKWGRLVENSEEALYEALREFIRNPQSILPAFTTKDITCAISKQNEENRRKNAEFFEELSGIKGWAN